MSLQPTRQTTEVNIDFITPWTQERGGCLSIATASGMYFAEYAFDPTDVVPLGIQLNDIEWMNLSRQYHRTFTGIGVMTDVPCGIVGIGTQGEYITDWLYLIGNIMPGDAAYVGPSGTFTNNQSLGGVRIGTFLSSLQADPHTVTLRGLGFSRQYVDPCTKQVVWENNPADKILIATPGFAKIKVDMGINLR